MKLKYFFFGLILFCISCSGQDQTKQQVQTEPPKTTTTTIINTDYNDGSYLSFSILNDNIVQVSFLSEKHLFKTSSEIETFIINNKKLIDPGKILVIEPSKERYDKLKTILKILSKYKYNKFLLLPK
ncbi:hypothetical protein GCM10022217_22770 [Chryseobacterium ginsenosidimutans]|uniref:hypothetical protein n=1 Tax=Chryseobacterium ginsenosidimutans TaxID=687846 RepID=UPI0031D235CE